MLIGILSDSHGRLETTRRAVSALTARGADVLLHLGDVGSEEVLDELVGHTARVVFGNCDWDLDKLGRHARAMDISVEHPMGILETEGGRVAFTHGHLPELMDRALRDGVEFLLHGHSHTVRDERVGGTRIINPGALHRATRYTAAILDPSTDTLEHIELPRSG